MSTAMAADATSVGALPSSAHTASSTAGVDPSLPTNTSDDDIAKAPLSGYGSSVGRVIQQPNEVTTESINSRHWAQIKTISSRINQQQNQNPTPQSTAKLADNESTNESTKNQRTNQQKINKQTSQQTNQQPNGQTNQHTNQQTN